MVNSPAAPQPMPKNDFIKALLSSDRPVDAYDLLTRLPIDPYHRVADIGCGPGFFSVPLAKYLSHGKLYALDIDNEMLAVLRNRVKAARLGNVEILGTDGLNFDLPPSSLDGTLLSFVGPRQQRQAGLPTGRSQATPGFRMVLCARMVPG